LDRSHQQLMLVLTCSKDLWPRLLDICQQWSSFLRRPSIDVSRIN